MIPYTFFHLPNQSVNPKDNRKWENSAGYSKQTLDPGQVVLSLDLSFLIWKISGYLEGASQTSKSFISIFYRACNSIGTKTALNKYLLIEMGPR